MLSMKSASSTQTRSSGWSSSDRARVWIRHLAEHSLILRTITTGIRMPAMRGVLHHMAQVHALRNPWRHEFLVYNSTPGDKNVVTVDSDKYDLFSDTRIFEDHPQLSILRYHPNDRLAYCTVHLTRRRSAGITGAGACSFWMHVDDGRTDNVPANIVFRNADLKRLWMTCIDDLIEPDDGCGTRR